MSLLWIQAVSGVEHPSRCTECKDPMNRDPWDESDRDPHQECDHCGGKGHHEECCSKANLFSPQLPDEYPEIESLHRGLSLDLPEDLHRHVNDPKTSDASAAHAILSHLDHSSRGRGLGNHWSSESVGAKGYAASNASDPNARLSEGHTAVVMHASPPDYRHVMNDRDEVEGSLAYEISPYSEDWPEVPVRSGAPIHLTGLSWRHGNSPWREHTFEHPVERRA